MALAASANHEALVDGSGDCPVLLFASRRMAASVGGGRAITDCRQVNTGAYGAGSIGETIISRALMVRRHDST